MYADGSAVITKHPGTGGLVSVGTVTAQLLYEVREPRYLTPDVAARFDTIDIRQEAPDRVRIEGVKGEPPTDSSKVCINNLGGNLLYSDSTDYGSEDYPILIEVSNQFYLHKYLPPH